MFVTLGMQHAKGMRRTILSSVVCPAAQYFPTFSHKRHDFRNKKIYRTQNVCFDFLHKFLYDTFLILRRTERDMIIRAPWSSCEVPLFMSDFNES